MAAARPLVFFVVLSTTATCALAAAEVCEDCSASEFNHIRFRDQTRSSSAGTIEICHSNYWQTICGVTDAKPKQAFTDNDANVACFQLGFTGRDLAAKVDLGRACKLGNAWPTLTVQSPCKGWEEQLSDCNLVTNNTDCTDDVAVIVKCTTTVQVRLFNDNAPSYKGRVMHYFNSHWRTVCDKNWTDNMNNSNVLCQQLGLGHAEDHHLESRSEEDTHFLHTDIDCSGTENKLRLCKHRFIPDDSCNGESVPWVKCTGPWSKPNDNIVVSSSYTSITLQWTVPEPLKYYPAVQGYRITYRENSEKDGNRVDQDLDQPKVTLKGLKAGTKYHVTVQLVLRSGHPGPETILVVSTTDMALVAGLASALAAILVLLLAIVFGVIVGIACWRRHRRENAGNHNERQHLLPIQQPAGRLCRSI